MIDLYFDTNVVLQCRDFDQVDWSALGLGDDVRLVIPIATLEELDNHKSKGNSRQAKRAKAFNSKYAELLRHRVSEIQVSKRRGAPMMRIAKFRALEIKPPLDSNKADNRIIAEVIAAVQDGEPSVLLSGDNSVMAKAVQLGCRIAWIPQEWELPPEPDESAKEIERLRKFERAHPNVRVSLLAATEDKPFDVVRVPAWSTKALTDEQVRSFVSAAQRRWERKQVITERLATVSLDTRDATWLRRLEEGAQILHHAYAHRSTGVVAVRILVENDGGKPAEGLLIKCLLSKGWALTGSAVVTRKPKMTFPYPRLATGSGWPGKSPEGTTKHMLDARLSPTSLRTELPKGCEMSGWDDGFVELHFAKFRHNDRVVIDAALSPIPGDVHEHGSIEFRVSMENHPEETSSKIRLRALQVFRDQDVALTSLDLDEDFDKLLREAVLKKAD